MTWSDIVHHTKQQCFYNTILFPLTRNRQIPYPWRLSNKETLHDIQQLQECQMVCMRIKPFVLITWRILLTVWFYCWNQDTRKPILLLQLSYKQAGTPTLKPPPFPRLYCAPLAHSPTAKQMILLVNSKRKLFSTFWLAVVNSLRRDKI